MKVAQWRMKPKWLDFPGLKYPDQRLFFRIIGPIEQEHERLFFFVCNSSRVGYFWFGAPLACMGIK